MLPLLIEDNPLIIGDALDLVCSKMLTTVGVERALEFTLLLALCWKCRLLTHESASQPPQYRGVGETGEPTALRQTLLTNLSTFPRL